MKLEIESVYADGTKTIQEWTSEDTIELYNTVLAFIRRFNPWMLRQSNDTKTLTMLEFGEEYEKLLDALKIPDDYEREDTEEDIAAGEEYARQQAKERAANEAR